MTDDWPQIKARLSADVRQGIRNRHGHLSDIRAALQRESEMRRERDAFVAVLDPEDRNVVSAMVNARALRQRVEELEREKVEGIVALCVCENAATPRSGCDCVTCTVRRAEQRAEAAEAKLAKAHERTLHLSQKLMNAEASAAHLFDQFAAEQKERMEAEAKLACLRERIVVLEGLPAEKTAEVLRAKLAKVVEALRDTRAILANDPTPVGAAMRRVESALAALAAAKGDCRHGGRQQGETPCPDCSAKGEK